MAAFGAQYPVFAPFKEAEKDTGMPVYDPAKKVTLGELVSANMTVALATGEIWGDDKQIENVSEFASASIPMETVDMVDEVASVVYGAQVVDQSLEFKPTDEAPYGGLGYFKSIMRNGKKSYKAYFYPKAKAALGNDNAQTKGSSVSFQTTTTNFTITAPLYDEGAWRRWQTCETIAEAKAWLGEQINPST